MRTRVTDRFAVAVCATAAGALFAILAGRPDAVVLVAPWFVVLALGLRKGVTSNAMVRITAAESRVVTGDDLMVEAAIQGIDGTADLRIDPGSGFWGPGSTRSEVAAAACLADCHERAQVPFVLTARGWGNHDLGTVDVAVTSRYGLFLHTGRFHTSAHVRVHPTPTQLHSMLEPWLVRRVYGTHDSRGTGQGVEYADLRPFSAGDSPRDINWRMSARSPELWVTERHPERATDVILLLDSFVESGHEVQEVVGLAIQAAVALAESHLSALDRGGLVELGGVVRWTSPGTGALQLQRLTDDLLSTKFYANAAERTLDVVPPRALPPRSFIMALSPLLDERFVSVLGSLSARGHDVAAIECAVAEDAYSPPRPEPEVNSPEAMGLRRRGELATRVWHAERQIVRDKLARQGVAVAHWPRHSPLEPVMASLTGGRVRVRNRAWR